jgi:fatty acid desaturase
VCHIYCIAHVMTSFTCFRRLTAVCLIFAFQRWVYYLSERMRYAIMQSERLAMLVVKLASLAKNSLFSLVDFGDLAALLNAALEHSIVLTIILLVILVRIVIIIVLHFFVLVFIAVCGKVDVNWPLNEDIVY